MLDVIALARETRDWISHPKQMCILSLFFGSVAFSPGHWLSEIGVQSFVDAHRVWFGLPFVFCVAVLLVESEEAVRAKWLFHNRLTKITREEKAVISRFLADGGHSTVIMWPWEAGVGTLVASGILVGFREMTNEQIVYALTPETLGYVKKHQSNILGLANRA
jgi:hypothetical protein